MKTIVALVGMLVMTGCSAQVGGPPERIENGSTSCSLQPAADSGVAASCDGGRVEYACTGPGAGTTPGVVDAPEGCAVLYGPAGLYCCSADALARQGAPITGDAGDMPCPAGEHACPFGPQGWACIDGDYYCALTSVACNPPVTSCTPWNGQHGDASNLPD